MGDFEDVFKWAKEHKAIAIIGGAITFFIIYFALNSGASSGPSTIAGQRLQDQTAVMLARIAGATQTSQYGAAANAADTAANASASASIAQSNAAENAADTQFNDNLFATRNTNASTVKLGENTNAAQLSGLRNTNAANVTTAGYSLDALIKQAADALDLGENTNETDLASTKNTNATQLNEVLSQVPVQIASIGAQTTIAGDEGSLAAFEAQLEAPLQRMALNIQAHEIPSSSSTENGILGGILAAL